MEPGRPRTRALVTAGRKGARVVRPNTVPSKLGNGAFLEPLQEREAELNIALRQERVLHLKLLYAVERHAACLALPHVHGPTSAIACSAAFLLGRFCKALARQHRAILLLALRRWRQRIYSTREQAFLDRRIVTPAQFLFDTLMHLQARRLRRRLYRWHRNTRRHLFPKPFRLPNSDTEEDESLLEIKKVKRRRKRDSGASYAAGAAAAVRVLQFEAAARQALQGMASRREVRERRTERIAAAAAIQGGWRRYHSRLYMYRRAEEERHLLAERRRALLWSKLVPGVVTPLLRRICVVAAARAAMKTRCRAYLLEDEEYRAAGRIRRAWRCHADRMRFLRTRTAAAVLAATWRRAAWRWGLQAELEARAKRRRRDRAAATSAVRGWARGVLLRRREEAECKRIEEMLAGIQRRITLGRGVFTTEPANGVLHSFCSPDDHRAMAAAFGVQGCQEMPQWFREELAVQRLRSAGASAIQREWRAYKLRSEVDRRADDRRRLHMAAAAAAVARRAAAIAAKAQEAWAGWCFSVAERIAAERAAAAAAAAALAARLAAEKAAREHRSSCVVQRSWRHGKGMRVLNRRFSARAELLRAERARIARENAAAARIERWYRYRAAAYNSPLRIVARNRLAARRFADSERLIAERREAAARVLQKWWRRRLERNYLTSRCTKQGKLLRKRKELEARTRAAKVVQTVWRKYCARQSLQRRFVHRGKRLAEARAAAARHAAEEAAATRIQRWVRKGTARHTMALRFQLRAKTLQERAEMAEAARRAAAAAAAAAAAREKDFADASQAAAARLGAEAAARRRCEEEAADYLLRAWRLTWRADSSGGGAGRPIWTNFVTEEVVEVAPQGWQALPARRWARQEDARGRPYYLDQLTGLKTFQGPCQLCYERPALKVCGECPTLTDAIGFPSPDNPQARAGMTYCEPCSTRAHRRTGSLNHHKPIDGSQGRETLQAGEKHCIECGFRRARLVCRQCGDDALCRPCSDRVHGSGHRRLHDPLLYEEYRRGWQAVEGRVEGEPTYFFNPSSGEVTYDKPEELMMEAELAEHKRCVEHRAAAESYARRIEQLQLQLEKASMEQDKLAYKLEQAEAAAAAAVAAAAAGAGVGAVAAAGATKVDEAGYRRMLLLSRKQRADQGQNVKQKKPPGAK